MSSTELWVEVYVCPEYLPEIHFLSELYSELKSLKVESQNHRNIITGLITHSEGVFIGPIFSERIRLHSPILFKSRTGL